MSLFLVGAMDNSDLSPSKLFQMDFSAYTHDQLIKAFQNEYEYLCHDNFDPETDMHPEQHLKWVQGITLEELQATIRQSIDNENIGLEDDEKTTIQDFMEQWLQ